MKHRKSKFLGIVEAPVGVFLFLSILTFTFDLILGSFFYFWGPNGLFLGLRKGPNTVLGSTHVVEQFSFYMFSSILTFTFDLILG